MKLLLFIHLIVLLLVCSCQSPFGKDEVRAFIPGTYIRSTMHEFGNEFDTIVITLQNAEAREYKITRRWKYERVLDGNLLEPEYKRHVTSGVYNNYSKILRENETGDSYSFIPEEEVLFIGTTKYKKL